MGDVKLQKGGEVKVTVADIFMNSKEYCQMILNAHYFTQSFQSLVFQQVLEDRTTPSPAQFFLLVI